MFTILSDCVLPSRGLRGRHPKVEPQKPIALARQIASHLQRSPLYTLAN
ncbi:hypothetical protein [Phormidesmis priestleyi]